MAGLNFLIKKEKIDQQKIKTIAVGCLLPEIQKYSEYYYQNNIIINAIMSENYPVYKYEDEKIIILIEGMIYNFSDSEILDKIKEVNFNDILIDINSIKKMITSFEGEYNISIYNKVLNKLFFFNDSLGRLPTYYSLGETKIITRNYNFIVNTIENTEINKESLIEYLLFEFFISENTLFNNIYKFLPGTILFIDINKNEHVKENVEINFDSYIKDKNWDKMDEVFIKLFNDRLNKINKNKILISLSGGLDSRGTLSAIIKNSVVPQAVNFNAPWLNPNEMNYAKNLADIFNIKITVVDLNDKYYDKWIEYIIKCKPGLYRVGNEYFYEFLNKVHEIYNSEYVFFSGLYGGEFTRYSDLTSGISNLDDLVEYLCVKNADGYYFPIKHVSNILNIDEDSIKKYIYSKIEKLPEENVYNKFKHYIFEKHRNWAGENEDRTRQFYWTITPYFSQSFLSQINGIKESEKNTKNFVKFLAKIDSRNINSDHYNGVTLTSYFGLSFLSIVESFAKNALFRRLIASFYRKFMYKNIDNKEIIDKIHNLLITMNNTKLIDVNYLKKCIDITSDTWHLTRIYTLLLIFDSYEKTSKNSHANN